jgi:carbon starvation protein
LTCLVPLAYLYVAVNYAGYWMISNVYLNPESSGYSVLNGTLSIIMLALGFVILVTSIRKWISIWNTPRAQLEALSA